MSDSISDSGAERQARHKRAMQRKKAHVDARIAEATIDKGLLVVLTGNSKGKSSSAFGMLARSVGHGLRCGVVQFIKGQWECGEHLLFNDHPLVQFHVMNTGFTWETQDRDKDIAAARHTWQHAAALLADPERSEEHTSELQSRENLVCRLLLEKKNNKTIL